MKHVTIPGFKSLFNTSSKSYDEYLKGIPSDIIIRTLISINAELNSLDNPYDIQKRLWQLITYKLETKQKLFLDDSIKEYSKFTQSFDGIIFSARYLLYMIRKEISRNDKSILKINRSVEFHIIQAYFICVDELHEMIDINEFEFEKARINELSQIKLIWKSILNQFSFNEKNNAAFEYYKFICFSHYAIQKFRPFVKEYLHSLGFQTFEQFLSSYIQLTKASTLVDKNQALQKLVYVVPNLSLKYPHFDKLCINVLFGKKNVLNKDINQYPLYKTVDRGYMVIDEHILNRKVYMGPLFETYYDTGLNRDPNKKISFEDYKTLISKGAIENLCFKGIIKSALIKKGDELHFDEDLESLPDVYFRRGKKILLIEFKDNLFPELISRDSNVDSFVKYIEERLIQSDKKQKKGIRQLVKNIELFKHNNFSFDKGLVKLLQNDSSLEIELLICYTDFIFSMPGVNEYFNQKLLKILEEDKIQTNVNRITLVNLQTLFHFLPGRDLNELSSVLARYNKILQNRKKRFELKPGIDNYLRSISSFEEIYDSIIIKDINKETSNKRNTVKLILKHLNIKSDLLKEIV